MCEEEEKTQGTGRKKQASLTPQLGRCVSGEGSLPPVAAWLERSVCPGWEFVSHRHSLEILESLQTWMVECCVCWPWLWREQKQTSEDESPPPDYVLLPLSNAFITASISQVFLKELPQYWGPGSSQQACEQDVSILQTRKLRPEELTELVSEGAGNPT